MDVALDTIIVRIVIYRRESEKRSTVDATVFLFVEGVGMEATGTDRRMRRSSERAMRAWAKKGMKFRKAIPV